MGVAMSASNELPTDKPTPSFIASVDQIVKSVVSQYRPRQEDHPERDRRPPKVKIGGQKEEG
jgi:hypothetical protein